MAVGSEVDALATAFKSYECIVMAALDLAGRGVHLALLLALVAVSLISEYVKSVEVLAERKVTNCSVLIVSARLPRLDILEESLPHIIKLVFKLAKHMLDVLLHAFICSLPVVHQDLDADIVCLASASC